MGGDGGVVATQRKFIRGAKDANNEKEDGKNTKEELRIRSHTCTQSAEKLQEPIVACEMGNLFNKEALLTALIEKTLNPSFTHIRGIKDAKTLILEPNPSYSEINETNGDMPSMFICPVTRMEFNGMHPFVVLWTTGYVLSEKCLREIGIENLQTEYGPFTELDIVRLVPPLEELCLQESRMKDRRIISKQQKKRIDKDNRKASAIFLGNTGGDITDIIEDEKVGMDQIEKKHKKQKKTNEKSEIVTLNNVKSNSFMNGSVKAATDFIKEQEAVSSVFKGLFHKDNEKDKHDRDLFMSVAGIRYTVG
eukprot:gene16575-22626_t